jgi:single-strand DNA-binding protein
MSLNLNQVILAGNLTRDPMLRKLPSGMSVAEFGLAIDDKYTAKDGNVVEQVCFVDIVSWARNAENAHAYLRKGDGLLLEGMLEYDAWQNDKGEKRNRLRVRARRLHFIGGRRRDEQASPDAPNEPAQPLAMAEHSGSNDAMPF